MAVEMENDWASRLGEAVFRYRSFTPIPLIILVLLFAHPTLGSIIRGYPFVVAGELIRFWSACYIGGISRANRVTGGRLVIAGPYNYMRNPLYLGNLFIASGETIAASSLFPAMFTLVFVFFIVQYTLIIPVEEKKLSAEFPDYAEYCRKVPGFFPLFPGYGGKGVANLLGGLRSERATLILRVVILAAILGLGFWRGDLSSMEFKTIF
jgi:protein-S-isoprenylcysteine O-methyltransferase Ste14